MALSHRAHAGGGTAALQVLATDVTELSSHIVQYAKILHQELRPESAFQDFLSYLCSPQADPLGPIVACDLSYPLSNYFISSSHNTYLSGNQLSSQSSVEEYRKVLLRACRCVEIDVWNGHPTKESGDGKANEHRGLLDRLGLHKHKDEDDEHPVFSSKEELHAPLPWSSTFTKHAEPRVLHGHTLTKEVPFRSVCESIRDSAFIKSDLPLIVSLEIHANHEQQERIVDIINTVWRDLLVDLPTSASQDITLLPAPGTLRNKILIKVKYTSPEAVEERAGNETTKSRNRSTSVSSSDEERLVNKKTKSPKMIERLTELGEYVRGYHFKGFAQPEAQIPTHIFALSEQRLMEVHEATPSDLFHHNQHYLMRTYPYGFRITSSNLDPTISWHHGVQIVALNWQSYDKGMMLNEGMFAATGGWVLKPKVYRSVLHHQLPESIPTPASLHSHGKLLHLDIEVFAAQGLPLPNETSVKSFRPYLKCILHADPINIGPQPDGRSKEGTSWLGRRFGGNMNAEDTKQAKDKFKARTRSQQGTSPDFSRELLQFRNVPIGEEELSFVRFKVQLEHNMRSDPLAAWACIRLDRLREGPRLLRLFDARGMKSSGMVFMKITKFIRDIGLERSMEALVVD